MTSQAQPKRFPALQAQMGDAYYYITTLTFEEVAQRVRPSSELVEPSATDMSRWIQRRVMPRRARQIAAYLIEQKQHFFPGIVVGVYLGEPAWYDINIGEHPTLGDPGIDPKLRDSLGLLELDGSEKLYAIDGQHRIAGIAEALKQLKRENRDDEFEQLANENLSIAFIAADIDKDGELERVRRLFTTLNKQAKRVSEPEIVAFDEDDPAAIITRWMAIRYEGLKASGTVRKESDHNLLQLGRQHEIRARNRRSVTTIVTLYRTIKSIFQAELRTVGRESKGNRPKEETLEKLYEESVNIWELMRQYDIALNDVLGSDPNEERAGSYRTERGGHILFRPVGLQAFAGALGLLRSRGVDNEPAIATLCQLPPEISRPPWVQVLWNPTSGNMITANKTVAEALYLHMVGHHPRTARYDLRKKYAELLGNPNEDPLQDVPVHELR